MYAASSHACLEAICQKGYSFYEAVIDYDQLATIENIVKNNRITKTQNG